MDTVIFDITDVDDTSVTIMGKTVDSDVIELLGERQTIDDLAAVTGTIGYEILTSLGNRFQRAYIF